MQNLLKKIIQLKTIFSNLSKTAKLKAITLERDKCMQRLLSGVNSKKDADEIQSQFSRLRHEELLLTNVQYRLNYERICELNKKLKAAK